MADLETFIRDAQDRLRGRKENVLDRAIARWRHFDFEAALLRALLFTVCVTMALTSILLLVFAALLMVPPT